MGVTVQVGVKTYAGGETEPIEEEHPTGTSFSTHVRQLTVSDGEGNSLAVYARKTWLRAKLT